jgi:hypothetical protein
MKSLFLRLCMFYKISGTTTLMWFSAPLMEFIATDFGYSDVGAFFLFGEARICHEGT